MNVLEAPIKRNALIAIASPQSVRCLGVRCNKLLKVYGFCVYQPTQSPTKMHSLRHNECKANMVRILLHHQCDWEHAPIQTTNTT